MHHHDKGRSSERPLSSSHFFTPIICKFEKFVVILQAKWKVEYGR